MSEVGGTIYLMPAAAAVRAHAAPTTGIPKNTMYEVGLIGAERSSILVEARSVGDAARAARALVPAATGTTWVRLADDHRVSIPAAEHYEVWIDGPLLERCLATPDRMTEKTARAYAEQFNADEAELARSERRPINRLYVVAKATVSREVAR